MWEPFFFFFFESLYYRPQLSALRKKNPANRINNDFGLGIQQKVLVLLLNLRGFMNWGK